VPDENTLLNFSPEGRDFKMAVRWCDRDDCFEVSEPFGSAADHFVAQDFFDEALVARPSGVVLAEFPRHEEPGSKDVELHSSTAETLNILNVGHFLKRSRNSAGEATRAQSTEAAPGKPDGAQTSPQPADLSGEPVAFNEDIGGRAYRVFVLPVRAPYPIVPETLAPTASASPERTLYLVGLQRTDITASIASALWPYGTGLISLLAVLFVLGWPLLNLALEHPDESISPRKALACIGAVILIPAILAIVAASIWSNRVLQNWADQNAQSFAARLSEQLHHEMIATARLLTSYRASYQAQLPKEEASHCTEPAQGSGAGKLQVNTVQASTQRSSDIGAAPDRCNTIRSSPGSSPEDNWSPVRNITALDAEGRRFGHLYTSFAVLPQKQNITLDDRAYFQATKHQEDWVARDGHDTLHFVAQRLFVRSDASKVLEVAVPLCDPDVHNADAAFCGIIATDSRIHSLVAPVTPPLLQFAVIDQASGTVLFHSDDRRSLAENFFRESENSAPLLAAIQSHSAQTFSGHYLGEAYVFRHQPMTDVPWSVVVFYPKKALGELTMQAAIGAAVGYAAITLACGLVAAIAGLLWWLCAAPPRALQKIAARLWPKPRRTPNWRERYVRLRRWHPSMWATVSLAIVTVAGVPAWGLAAVAFLLLGAGLTLVKAKPSASSDFESNDDQQRRYQLNAHVECMTSVLFLVAILPAFALFFIFHDDQLAGVVRDGLLKAAYQTEARHDIIRRDLQRWVPVSGQEWIGAKARYPDAWTVTENENLTARFFGSPPTGSKATPLFAEYPWSGINPPQLSISAARQIWQGTLSSRVQWRRFDLATQTTVCGPTLGECSVRATDRHPIQVETATGHRNFLVGGGLIPSLSGVLLM
jgi:hypothetical protein